MSMRIKSLQTYAFICLIACAAVCLPFSAVLSQVTPTARVELNDKKARVYIGENIYVTKDPERRLTAETIAQRHENNLRGERMESRVLNLGPRGGLSWLVFSVTNDAAAEDWMLDFGGALEGRSGFARALTLTDRTNDLIYASLPRESGDSESPEDLLGSAVPLRIGPGKTSLFIVRLEMEPGRSGSVAPSLVREDVFLEKMFHGTWLNNFVKLFFIAAVLSFSLLGLLYRSPFNGFLAGYFLLTFLAFLMIDKFFFVGSAFAAAVPNILFLAAAFCGLLATKTSFLKDIQPDIGNAFISGTAFLCAAIAAVNIFWPAEGLVFLPQIISAGAIVSVSLFKSGQPYGPERLYYAAGWGFCLFGIFAAAMNSYGFFSLFGANAYWLFLIPQAACLFLSALKLNEYALANERNLAARESQAQSSLARLKQSRESADQARLMRVIERERELMAELREREAQRAEEMSRAREAADLANRAKSAFLAVVSHEIRTPMTGIMGIVRLLKDTKLTREQADYLLAVQKSGDTMMALLNDILDFEKIESGAMRLERIDFDLPKLAQSVVTLMSGHAAGKNIELLLDIDAEAPRYAVGDPTRLRQVLLNLVGNALKFTERGAVTVRVRVKTASGKSNEIQFAVEDTGVGISEEAQAMLFQPFEQTSASVARKHGGTGLGLAICQRLVEAMGGTIRVSSAPGTGSTFFFTLPMEQGDARMAEENEGFGARPMRKSATPMNILVVEDNEINRKVLQRFLEKEGHYVTACGDGESALALCRKNDYGAVLMDINLSGSSGLDALQAIRALKDSRKSSMPILAVTGETSDESAQKIMRVGFNGIVTKPIDFEKLSQEIADIHTKRAAAPRQESERDLNQEQPLAATETERDRLGAIDEESLDAAVLNNLVDSLGKLQMIGLMNGFMEKADDLINDMRRESEVGDLAALLDHAHDLKGMAGNFGVKELVSIAASIEKAAKAQDAGKAIKETARLADAGERAKLSIKKWLG